MRNEAQNISYLPDFCRTRIVFVVILLGELLAIILTLAQPPYISNRMFEFAMFSLFIQWIALSSVAALCICGPYLRNLDDVWLSTICYSITIIVSLIITELAWWTLNKWPVEYINLRYGHALFVFRSLGISAIVSALVLRYFYVRHQWRLQSEAEAESRFQALQSKIRPHFLFNCMNTIASLTRRNPKHAEEAIIDLADLFRVSLQDAHDVISLKDELTLCERYLRIEKHRLGDRLNIEWDITELPEDALLPPLVLQPLLENAIYHGLETMPDGGTIKIYGREENKFLNIIIENPVPDGNSDMKHHSGNQLALDNISQRLSAFFEQANLIQVDSGKAYYRISLLLPYRNENTDR